MIDPVSIPRGSSALVPILQATMPYRRELLFNEDKLADHPVAALRCSNESGLVLERGPATLLEDGAYRGEAIVPFTGRQNELYLPYASELGIRVIVEPGVSDEVHGLSIAGAMLHREVAYIHTYAYRVINRTQSEQIVTLERATRSLPGELLDTRTPDARTEDGLRWDVQCAPGSEAEIRVGSRNVVSTEQSLERISYAHLAEFLLVKGLDTATKTVLKELHDQQQQIEAHRDDVREIERRRTATVDARNNGARTSRRSVHPAMRAPCG